MGNFGKRWWLTIAAQVFEHDNGNAQILPSQRARDYRQPHAGLPRHALGERTFRQSRPSARRPRRRRCIRETQPPTRRNFRPRAAHARPSRRRRAASSWANCVTRGVQQVSEYVPPHSCDSRAVPGGGNLASRARIRAEVFEEERLARHYNDLSFAHSPPWLRTDLR